MQTCFTFTCLKKLLRKPEKHLRQDQFFESCWITDHDLLKVVNFNGNLKKMLIAALKDKKSSHNDTEENLHFKQSRLNYINSQKQNHKRTHKTVIVFIGVDVLARIVDEFYILFKIYSYFSFFSVSTYSN